MQPKLSFFAWEASWGRVLTLDCLQKRGWASANRCFLCQTCEELIDYLLHCEKTREVWMLLLSFFGVSWVFPFSVKETFLGWRGSFVGKKRKVAWQVGSLCLFWVIWKARNKIDFEDSVLSIQRLKASFMYLLWSETKLWIKNGPSTLIDFVDWVCSRWRRRFFCFFLVVLVPFVRGWVSLFCNSVGRYFSASLQYIFCLLIKNIYIQLHYQSFSFLHLTYVFFSSNRGLSSSFLSFSVRISILVYFDYHG